MAGAGNKSSYYAVLDVAREASADEIQAAWRKMSEAFHPDRVKEVTDNSWVKEFVLAKYRQVQEAYEVLSDPAKKALYDAGYDAALGVGGDKGAFGSLPRPRVAAGIERPPPPPLEGRINLFFTFDNAEASDSGPGTSGRGGGGGGPQNGRGKQRPRRRTVNSILEAKMKFLDGRKR
ncbi:unnamed protein product [Urochloa decumbens]|uniref:J domain-containing protein n=1 Tax=Urochloa decumbens TaxID=240449 RepID=A0ABC8WLM7_9POAL